MSIYPRTNYEMTEDDLAKLLDAMKQTPVMFITGGIPIGGSTQENANRAWQSLGEKMGFDYMTVQPISGKGNRFFTAIPTETEEARAERESRENEEKLRARIAKLREEIDAKQAELSDILNRPLA